MEFQERFATEEACCEYLFASRWPEGFVCSACGGHEVGEMHRRRPLWQCGACGHQTSVTAGTIMHGTRTPLRLWFWAAYLVAILGGHSAHQTETAHPSPTPIKDLRV